jgi:hypothetical protein
MDPVDLHYHFLAIWHRAKNQPSLDSLTPTLIESWAHDRNLIVEDVEERDVGTFGKTRSILLKVAGERACFPKLTPNGDSTWEQRKRAADWEASLWEKMESKKGGQSTKRKSTKIISSF